MTNQQPESENLMRVCIRRFTGKIVNGDGLMKQSVLSWGIRIIAAVLGFLNLKILGQSLPGNSFSLVLLVYSFLPWFNLFDFGLGAVAQNEIALAKATNIRALRLIRFFSIRLSLICLIVCIAWGLGARHFIPWVFGKTLASEAAGTLFYYGGFLMIAFGVGGVASRMLLGSGRVILSQALTALSVLVSTILLLVLKKAEIESSTWYLFALILPGTLIFLVTLIWLLFSRFEANGAQEVPLNSVRCYSLAGRFWVFAIISAFTLQIDYFFLARFGDVNSISIYLVAAKLFGVLGLLCSTFSGTLMPRFTVVGASGNIKDSVALINRSKAIVLFVCLVVGAFIVIFFPLIASFIKKGVVSEGYAWLPVLVLFWIYASLQAWISIDSAYLQSNNFINIFIWGAPVQALISATGQYLLVTKIGASGILIGMILGQVLVPLWVLPMYIRRRSSVCF